MSFKRLLVCVLPVLFFAITFCNRQSKTPQTGAAYLNLHDSVKYVGMETCRSCHAEIYESYIQTGMGKSFDHATKQKTSARFAAHDIVYDSLKNFYYKPFWENDSLFIQEFRLKNNDTVHSRTEFVNYIIGSGQHTNSHICNFSGFLYQAPITFYTQSQKWDMAPGFEGGFNSRFERIIGMECMSCHNALPEFDRTSENRFNSIPQGVDCERCHGPGEIHVKQKLAGIRVDTSKYIDYSIVNPRKLSRELQTSLCQRCHLQGVAVLNDGKNFDDFKPGMKLSEVFNVFMPKFETDEHAFIMASHADRLTLSSCYKKSEMTCITCHNPHVSVKVTPAASFNSTCVNCHNNGKFLCSEKEEIRLAEQNDCIKCHMPKSGSLDIPHVMVTDHHIQNPRLQNPRLQSWESKKIKDFLALQCLTDEQPAAKTMAKGYLAFYEKFSPRSYLLDSAERYIFQTGISLNEMAEPLVHFYFLKEDYQNIVDFAEKSNDDFSADAWTFYRIGEAYFHFSKTESALLYFQKAKDLKPLSLDFQNKFAAVLFALNRASEAKSTYEFIIAQQPKYKSAVASLGYLYLLERNFGQARDLLNKALALDPDYETALLNLAILNFETRNFTEAKKMAERLLEINPENTNAMKLLQHLNQSNP